MSESDDALPRPEIKLDGVPVADPSGDVVQGGPPRVPRPPRPTLSRLRELGPQGRRLLVAGLAVLVLAVAVPVAFTLDDDGGGGDGAQPTPSAAPSPTVLPAQVFRGKVVEAYGATGGVLNIYLTREIRRWRSGGTTAYARAALQNVLPGVQRAREALDQVPPFEQAPTSLVDFQAGLTLYLQSVKLGLAATTLPDNGVQRQLRTQTLRLQILGDRLFDQGTHDLDGLLPQLVLSDAVTLQPPPEVPDFTNSGLLAARPLVPAPRTVVEAEPPTGANQQAIDSWVSEATAVGTPSAGDVSAAIAALDPTTLGTLANRLTNAALAIRRLDDPASGRKDSTRVQLSLFVDAEAARAAEAAALTPAGASREALLVIARTLAEQSDVLWDSRLGPRDSGYPADLLTAR